MSTNTENTTITTTNNNNRTFITQLDASTVASVALDGHVSFNASRIRKVEKNVVVVKEQNVKQKVAIISGGGSGHEPAMAGFVGEGFFARLGVRRRVRVALGRANYGVHR